ncbi:MAG: PspC domain-containing protein [Ancrocorticia sp.]|nr:PspC domain-containing protein [Ancrocorticia sp.]MCI2029557.1 PspC domain-containing protein [Ancrocorticia sp.]
MSQPNLHDAAGHTRMIRPRHGRVVAGVAAGLAGYLHLRVAYVRIAFVVLSLVCGFGIVLYVLLAFMTPLDGTVAVSAADRVTQRISTSEYGLRAWAVALIAAAVIVVVRSATEMRWQASFVVPAIVMAVGILLSWWQLSRYAGSERPALAQEGKAESSPVRPAMPSLIIQAVAGVIVATGGALMLVLQGLSVSDMVRSGAAAAVVLLGVALIVAPWGLRLWNELIVAREEKARETNRAEMAAHIHDSVLQTLAMIRTRAHDPVAVAQLARSQERELREWLYQGTPNPQTSLAQELRDTAAQVEDTRRTRDGESAAIDVVCVGDCQPNGRTDALMHAAREAMTNAVIHGAPPISVYMEVTERSIDVYVSDRGTGFRIEAIPSDRLGVRNSIIGRMQRIDGSVKIRSLPDGGTEVHMWVARMTS